MIKFAIRSIIPRLKILTKLKVILLTGIWEYIHNHPPSTQHTLRPILIMHTLILHSMTQNHYYEAQTLQLTFIATSMLLKEPYGIFFGLNISHWSTPKLHTSDAVENFRWEMLSGGIHLTGHGTLVCIW